MTTRLRKYQWLFALVPLLTVVTAASAQTRKIALEEYLALHDYAEYGYYEWWNNPATPDVWVLYDPLGSRVAFFGGDVGTTVTGNVTVRSLPDGRALVTVLMHSKNAICWVYDWALSSSISFGASPRQVALLGYTPSLGQGMERIEFTMPSPETPLPPLWELWSDEFPVTSVVAEISCKGTLNAASGYPAGTPGMAHVAQRALFATGVPTGCPAGDCWPAEQAFYKPTGK